MHKPTLLFGLILVVVDALDPQPPRNAWQSSNGSHPWQNADWQTKPTGTGTSSVIQNNNWPSLSGSSGHDRHHNQNNHTPAPAVPVSWGPPLSQRTTQAPNIHGAQGGNPNHHQKGRPQQNRNQRRPVSLKNVTKVTDDELTMLSEKLFREDVNNAGSAITLNYQSLTKSNALEDAAPSLLLSVGAEAYRVPTIQVLRHLYDNYIADTSFVESVTAAERQEENAFLDKVLETDVMKTTMEFLADKGLVDRNMRAFKDLLHSTWFTMYSRGGGIIGSSAFEHVFLGELKKDEVSGLHNWVYFANEEENNHVNYMGYLRKLELGRKATLVKIHYRYYGTLKPSGTMFVGTSPELEMALYTVCFLTRPNDRCPVILGGKSFGIQTYDYRYRGKTVIGSAYPIF